jgi:uncharacterized protein (TIGR02996 family)
MPNTAKSPFPKPAAVLPGEADILAKVIADLSDHTAKLVYADWLEERDDPRGSLLRDFVIAFQAKKKLPPVDDVSEAWRNLVGLRLMELLAESPIAHKANRVLALARPVITYKREAASERSLLVGASRIGGCPDLPPETEWPEYEGEPLGFLAQINFAELQPSPIARELPSTGVMSLFCLHDKDRDTEDFLPGTYRVLYSSNPTQLQRRAFPDELPEEARVPVRRLWFTEEQTIPDLNAGRTVKALLKEKDEYTAYDDVQFNTLSDDGLLGHPHLLGRASTKAARHLISIGDVEGWIDDDVMYFLMSEADLKRDRFDRAKMVLRQF